jgi:hypothetical protein
MKKIAFISDYFINDGIGGAELTTNTIMNSGAQKGFELAAIHCNKINKEVIEQNKDHVHFVVCNFVQLQDEVKLYMIKNSSYSIIEYDYKICEYRSYELHEQATGQPCNCETKLPGKINAAFYGYAERMFFMSEKQKNMIMTKVPVLKEENCKVLNSVFSAGDLKFISSIKENDKDDKYIILNSDSPVKGTDKCVEYAEENKLEYELVQNLPYHELLIRLSTSKGLIFMPVASDTCPRLVMEAKMLGCELILNDHVQHKDEHWFATQESCYEHMNSRTDIFWSHYE